jgi:hypothetical protein
LVFQTSICKFLQEGVPNELHRIASPQHLQQTKISESTCDLYEIKPNILPKRNYAGKITRQANTILVRLEVLHRNRCFDGIAPSLAAAMAQAEEEKRAWELAGAKEISFLVAQVPGA